MATNNLCAGVLSLLLIHDETGCRQSAQHAIRLLDALCADDDVDGELRDLCERASRRLELRLEVAHACAA